MHTEGLKVQFFYKIKVINLYLSGMYYVCWSQGTELTFAIIFQGKKKKKEAVSMSVSF